MDIDTSEYIHSFSGQHIYKGILYSSKCTPESLEILNTYPFKSTDIFVCSYPKAGTLWVSGIVDLLLNGINLEKVKEKSTWQRLPCPEQINYHDDMKAIAGNDQRAYVSHMQPTSFAPHLSSGKFKAIYVFRNPKDQLVSYYNFYPMMREYEFDKSWDDFFEMFKRGQLVHGNWFDHVTGWLKLQHLPNVHLVMYEELKKHTLDELQRISAFLGCNYGLKDLKRLESFVSFDVMKKDPDRNLSTINYYNHDKSSFIRKGEIGGWKNYFNEEQNKYMDERIKSKLADCKVKLIFE